LVTVRQGATLCKLPVFNGLEPNVLDFLGMRCVLRMLKKSETVHFHAAGSSGGAAAGGATGDGGSGGGGLAGGEGASSAEEGLCVVVTGCVSVSIKLAGDGTKRELRRMGPGQFCGEAALVGVWTVGSASALEPSLVFTLSAEDMDLFSALDMRAKAQVTRVSRFRTAEALWAVSFFNDVPLAKREMLAAVFDFSARREGDEFYALGQTGRCFYVVCQGEVELQGERGESIRTLRQGMCFGESALLVAEPRKETAMALGPGATVCVCLTKEGFERFLESAPEMRANIRAALERSVAADIIVDESAASRAGIWVPTSADELASVTNLPVDFMQSPESKEALDAWAEIGTVMAPCLRSLLGCVVLGR
jgi:CRP-like cAMP-binding protein